ncbi:long tail fiber protein distal subunit [Vibrio phage ValKK3]|uniref:Long tail fiber protein Gp37 n=1 Tax=Vibrio phage ValKK3 TaxID=1610855 RepID=A0A0D4DB35_9CAUD|nr:long tail fiber protein distal subunit [Vibrio phage ValKK3]AJT61189.1 long tail fiber distal subunit [Vibrio phage ValKK3]
MAKLGPTNIFGALNVSSMAHVGSLVVDTELFAQNTQKVFHDAYHPNADKWTTARTLNLGGDASGSVSWDGSSDVTLNVTVADDSHTHETQYISKTQPYNDNILSGSIGGSDGKPLLQVNGASAYLGSTGRAGLQLATSTNPEWIGGGGAYKLFNDAYHPNADKWTNARTLTLSGDLSGSVSIDGSSNVTLSASVANDSHTHDGRYYTESEADSRFANVSGDTFTGDVYINAALMMRVGTTPAIQRADARADDTNYSRLHWYGRTDTGATSNFRHAWYDGSDYINVSASSSSVNFDRVSGTAIMRLQGNRVFADNYHPNADRWTTSRTLSLNGDASGSVSINGSSNVTLTVTVANDSHTHDGRYYTESESNSRYVYKSGDTMTGELKLKAGSHAGASIKALDGGVNGTNLIISSGGNTVIASGETTAANAVSSGNTSEDLHVGSDGTIYMYTNAQSWGSRKTFTLSTGGNFTAPGNITAYSDIRIKTDIKRIVNPLEKIDMLNGYTYERTDIDGPRQTGVIAQEVIEVLPEAVVEQNNMYSVSYGNMVGLLIEGIKEEKRKREALEKRLEKLEKLLN